MLGKVLLKSAVEFVNDIVVMPPRYTEYDSLQLFIFSFTHKLWVKCI